MKKRRRGALLGGSLLLAAVAIWLLAGVRNVPDGAVGLLDSPVRGQRVLEPGLHLGLRGLESFELLDPYRRSGDWVYTTPQGADLELVLEFGLRLDADAARELLEQGRGESARARLAEAIDRRVAGVLDGWRGGRGLPVLEGPLTAAVGEALAGCGQVEGELVLRYAEDSPVVLAVREREARDALRAQTRDTGVRFLIVGIDGADWQIAEPLIADGRLPHLASLQRRGAWGNLKSLTPILSPLIWTSVVTGVTPDRHGIIDFLVRDPESGEKVPVNSRFRQVRALWNQFTDAGLRSDIVAWWATWPAEEIAGHMISDRVSYSLWDFDLPAGGAGATWPSAYFEEIRPLLVGDEEIPFEEVARFADISREEFEQARASIADDRSTAYRNPINHLTKILAATRSYHAISLELLRESRADLTAVYYQGIDEVCHRFIHFAPPRLEGVDPEDVRRYGRVVERFYVYQDRLLGELLEAAGPETTVIVLSDHGFVNGPDRPAGETADIEGQPGRWHRRYGILAMAGPPIAAVELDTSSILDISPTVLRLAGLPVPEDSDGSVLQAAIRPDFAARHPESRIATYETTPLRIRTAADSPAMAAVEEEILEQLRSLGYIGGPAGPVDGEATSDGDALALAEKASGDTVTAHTNLAGVLLSSGELERAEEEIEAALRLVPGYPGALRQLFDLRVKQQRHDEAIEVAEGLMARPGDLSPVFLARVARAYQSAGRVGEGIRYFRKQVEAGRPQFGNPLARLLLESGDVDGADEAARRVLADEPMNEAAMAVVVRIARSQRRVATVKPLLEAALAINPRSLMHLNWMAIVHEDAGDVANAERMLQAALKVDPDHGPSMANLGAFHGRNGRAEDAVPLLERALRINPGNVEARVNLGSALGRLERYPEAIDEFERLVADGHRSTMVFNALAKACGESGDPAGAAGWLRRSLELDPDQAGVRRALESLDSGSR